MKQIVTMALLTALALETGTAFAGDKMADMKGGAGGGNALLLSGA